MIDDRCTGLAPRSFVSMIFVKHTFKILFLLTLFSCAVIHGQEPPKQLTRDQLISAAREIMSSSRYSALITLDSAGRPQARTVDPFPPDENMVVWLATNPRTRKVAEIRRNPRVTLYYFDREAQAYVTISGIARLVNDPKEKANRWKDEWKKFYPDRDKSYLLIEVTPERLEVVNVSKGILGDPQDWRPPSFNLRRNKRR